MTTALGVSLTIAATDYSAYFVSLERDVSLDKPGATVKLSMSPALSFGSLNPWDDLVIFEDGVKTFTGYVTHIIPSRPPAKVEVDGMDTFKRCLDWFLDDVLYTSGSTGGTIGYYVGYLCALCGISYSINDTAGADILLEPNIPLGLRSVSDALTTLAAGAQWNMRVDASGVLQFDHINHPSAPDYTLTQGETFEQDINDTDTRNQVKVWGFQDITSGSDSIGGTIVYVEGRAVAGENITRTMVFADPHIDTLAKAQELASAALDQWARLENVLSIDSPGNPNITVGQAVQFIHPKLTSGSYMDVVTDIRDAIDGGKGYVQTLTAGRRAYRYPYWPLAQAPRAEWGAGDVKGFAADCHIFGDSVYVGGFTFMNNDPTKRAIWRIERRLLADGSLVWGVNEDIAASPNLAAGSVYVGVMGLQATLDGLWLCGQFCPNPLAGNFNKWRVEFRNKETGALVWSSQDPNLFGASSTARDIIVNGSGGFVNIQAIGVAHTADGYPSSTYLQPFSVSGTLGIPIVPITDEVGPDGRHIKYPIGLFSQMYLDSDGGWITGGTYTYPYQLSFINPFLPPENWYFAKGLPWFGKFDAGANKIWEVKAPFLGIGDTAFGVDLTCSIDALANLQYRGMSDSAFGETGGLRKYNQTSLLWAGNIGISDTLAHVEIGAFVFIAPGSLGGVTLEWYSTSSATLIGTRSDGDFKARGIQIYTLNDQLIVSGMKSGLFWTALWDQPI